MQFASNRVALSRNIYMRGRLSCSGTPGGNKASRSHTSLTVSGTRCQRFKRRGTGKQGREPDGEAKSRAVFGGIYLVVMEKKIIYLEIIEQT